MRSSIARSHPTRTFSIVALALVLVTSAASAQDVPAATATAATESFVALSKEYWSAHERMGH